MFSSLGSVDFALVGMAIAIQDGWVVTWVILCFAVEGF